MESLGLDLMCLGKSWYQASESPLYEAMVPVVCVYAASKSYAIL
jgi:hypothetical protein